MKVSCLPVSFFQEMIQGRMTIGQWARLGHALGLDGIDLSIALVPDRSPAALDELRREIEDAGTRVVMVTSYPDFTHPAPAQRLRELALEQEVVATAARLGAELVRVTAGQAHPGVRRGQGIEWAVNGITRLARAVCNSGISLVYENHARPMVWDFTDFSQPPDIFVEIAQQVAGAGVGVNFDTGNAAAFSDDPAGLLKQVLPLVVSVHAADTAVHGRLEPVLLGAGITPFAALFETLCRHGWDGWICMEEASGQGPAGVAAAAQFIRQTWSDVSKRCWASNAEGRRDLK